jgi:hypothetical protein
MSALGSALFELDDVLVAADVRYAIGGALALAYYAQPRATGDIDLCVSTPQTSAETLLDRLAAAGWSPQHPGVPALPVAGVRLVQADGLGVCDLFFSFDPFHGDLLANAILQPFVNGTETRMLPFAAPDDYVVLKLSFSRPKDWVDIGALLEAGTRLDVDYIERQLTGFRGASFHPHVARLRRMMADRALSDGPPSEGSA